MTLPSRLLSLYGTLFTGFIIITAFLDITTPASALFPLLLLPANLYFLRLLFRPTADSALFPPDAAISGKSSSPQSSKRHPRPASAPITFIINQAPPSPVPDPASPTPSTGQPSSVEPEVLSTSQIKDLDRRLFLKLIGSAGVTAFLFSLFTDRAHGAFFGSVPGPGTVALKDSTGSVIDPAIKQPTDGYKIAQLDDTSDTDYAYYGFVDKDGNWYIQREALTGANAGQYLYVRGSDTPGFASEWADRTTRTDYATFDNIF